MPRTGGAARPDPARAAAPRLDAGTLLPGTLRKAEAAFKLYEMQTVFRVVERPVPAAAALQGLSRLMAY